MEFCYKKKRKKKKGIKKVRDVNQGIEEENSGLRCFSLPSG